MPSSSESHGAGYAERQATLALRKRLTAHVRQAFELRLNTNRRTFFSCRTAPNAPARISLHRCFLEAPDGVIQAVGALISGPDDQALALCREYVAGYDQRHRRQARSQPLPPELRRSRGQWHDLADIADEVNRRYFEGRLTIRITWGKSGAANEGRRRRRPRTLQFGSYDHSLDLVRIHSRLDAPDVPRFYLNYLIYHELLHKTLGCRRDGASSRRSVHHAEFLEHERRHECYDLARAWEQEFFKSWIAQPIANPDPPHVSRRPEKPSAVRRPPRSVAPPAPAPAEGRPNGHPAPPRRERPQSPSDPDSPSSPAAPHCEQLQLFEPE